MPSPSVSSVLKQSESSGDHKFVEYLSLDFCEPICKGDMFNGVLPYTWRYIWTVIKLRLKLKYKKGFYTPYENTQWSYIRRIVCDKIFRGGYERKYKCPKLKLKKKL